MPWSQIPTHLYPGWRPSEDELADAGVIDKWQVIARTRGPYLLQGTVGGRPFFARLRAMGAADGWALTADRLLVLGERVAGACIALTPDEVMQRAGEPADERSAIQAETAALAERARRAGMPIFAYLLDVAAIEAANARIPKREGSDGQG